MVGQLPEAGGEGAGEHPTVAAVGKSAAQVIQKLEQGHDVLFSVSAQSLSKSYGAGVQKTRGYS